MPHWLRALVPTDLQTLLHLEPHSSATGEGQELSSTGGGWNSGDREVREIPPSTQSHSLGAHLVKSPPATRETWVQSLGWEDSPGERKGYPLQYSGLENSMDCVVHGVSGSDTTEQLSLHFTQAFSDKFRTQVAF